VLGLGFVCLSLGFGFGFRLGVLDHVTMTLCWSKCILYRSCHLTNPNNRILLMTK